MVHITVCYINAYTDIQMDTCTQYTVTYAKHAVVCTQMRTLTHACTQHTYTHTHLLPSDPLGERIFILSDFVLILVLTPVWKCISCVWCVMNHMNVGGYFDQSVCFLISSFDWKRSTKHRKQRFCYSNREPSTNSMEQKVRLKVRKDKVIWANMPREQDVNKNEWEITARRFIHTVKYLTSNVVTQKTSNQPFKSRLDVCRMVADKSKEGAVGLR